MKRVIIAGYLLVIVGLLELSNAQDRIIFRDDDDDEDNRSFTSPNSLAPMKIPERLLIRLKDVRNETDFFNRFVVPDRYSIVTEGNISSISSRRAPAAGGAGGPTSDYVSGYCQPEQQVVELENPGNGAIYLWPSCVRVSRCGGCCTSKMLTCSPVRTSYINISVNQLVYNFDPESLYAFEDQGKRIITLEQHDQCVCKCAIQPEDCGPRQLFREDECRCICSNQEQATQCTGPKRIWDIVECLCRCRHVLDCSTGYEFHPRRCRCERSTRVDNFNIQNGTATGRSAHSSLNMNATV